MMKNSISLRLMSAAAALSLASIACLSSISSALPGAPTPAVTVVDGAVQVIPTQAAPYTPLPPEIVEQFTAQEAVLVDLYRRVDPAVVNIVISSKDRSGDLVDVASGSGFV